MLYKCYAFTRLSRLFAHEKLWTEFIMFTHCLGVSTLMSIYYYNLVQIDFLTDVGLLYEISKKGAFGFL